MANCVWHRGGFVHCGQRVLRQILPGPRSEGIEPMMKRETSVENSKRL